MRPLLRPTAPTAGKRHLLPGHPARGFSVAEQRLRRQLAALTAVSTALLAADNLAEHYRGGFHHRAMWVPAVLGPVVVTSAALTATASARHCAERVLVTASFAQAAAGVVGFALHCRGIARRPGRGARHALHKAWYGPPALAPLQYTGLAVVGVMAAAPPSWLRPVLDPAGWARLGRLYVAATTPPLWAEVTLFHSRGAYHHPLMRVPVTVLPAVALASALAVADQRAAPAHRVAAVALTVLGSVGTMGHVRGTARQHGGFSRGTALFNVLTGPPPTAPLQMVTTGLVALSLERVPHRGGRRG